MKVLSLFDGMSCGQIALNRAGIKYDQYLSCEIDKYAIEVTQSNYPKTIQLGNVFDVDLTRLKDVDLLLGGSPCTNWSIAKKNRETNTNGIGWELFKKYSDAVTFLKPKWFIYENNYSIHKDIKNAITDELQVDPIMIDSSLLSAQRRKRMYWTNIPGVTQPENKKIYLKDILEEGVCDRDKSYCIDANYYKGTHLKHYLKKSVRQIVYKDTTDRLGFVGKNKEHQSNRVYSTNGKSVSIKANGGGQGAKTGLYYTKEGIRKLTPIECERLQTVPDRHTSLVSNTQRYKMLGNGWTIDVIVYILKNI